MIIQGQHFVSEISTYRPPIYTLQDTVSCSRCGISASGLRYPWVTPKAHWCYHCLSIAVDYATVTSVFCIVGPGDLPYISMTMSQTLQTTIPGDLDIGIWGCCAHL
ncbi:hypothetical protein ATANTOWER_020668 [Ataeniobius toweri]|uniref:Uncharacterized protein n=1 Tax=Ataeniobius toweri TaxID=208326 RepID=A0ABU7AGM3_9TELE|nr:hypothetical protein [Ataeniobius toweri]